jgi:agmatine deiminase
VSDPDRVHRAVSPQENESLVPPGRRGYRWPAEWEKHRATWLSWPHNSTTWSTGLEPIEDAFCEIVRALMPGESVEINVDDAGMAARASARLRESGISNDGRIRFHFVPTDDAWIRDHGGIVVLGPEGPANPPDATTLPGDAVDSRDDRILLDFVFDAWGGKYPPWDRDQAVARTMAEALDIERFESPFVLEAGSIDGDGEGTILTTESCLLHSNRVRPGQDRSREGMQFLLAETLGAKRVLWLGEGIEGDDTDGHVDDLTRFIAPGRVVTIVANDASDPDHAVLLENRRRLETFSDAAGRRLEVIELPTPGRIEGREGRLPASYANFYVANEVVLVPTFAVDADDEALRVIAGCFPDRMVVPIPSRALVEGLGALHCLTHQEPAGTRLPGPGQRSVDGPRPPTRPR